MREGGEGRRQGKVLEDESLTMRTYARFSIVRVAHVATGVGGVSEK